MKKFLSCCIFLLVALALFVRLNDILLSTNRNRYYMMDHYLEQADETYDVEVYGSCHAYTSFNPKRFTEEHGYSAFDLAYPSEIIPTTYVRMATRFKNNTPKVALVEIWGINAYNTYIDSKSIFNDYMLPNVEGLPLSAEKIALINDYEHLNLWEMSFPIFRYKNRLMDNSLSEIDFEYAFDKTYWHHANTHAEMDLRFQNRGYKPYRTCTVEDYPDLQAVVDDSDIMHLEADIEKYVHKIIDLCEEYDVELIFYRSPYVSNPQELQKANYFRELCEERSVTYIDLEKDLDYDYLTDFTDYEHLSETGAAKSTDYLTDYILSAIERQSHR